jgi:hypothetical protein
MFAGRTKIGGLTMNERIYFHEVSAWSSSGDSQQHDVFEKNRDHAETSN